MNNIKLLTVLEYSNLKKISKQAIYSKIKRGILETEIKNNIMYIVCDIQECLNNIESIDNKEIEKEPIESTVNSIESIVEQEVKELKLKLAEEHREKEKLEKELYLYKINYNRVTAENKGLMEQKEGLINFNNSLQADKEQLNKLLEQSNILQRMALEQVKQLEQVQEEKKGFFKRLFRI